MPTDAQKRANAKYQKEKTKQLSIRFTPQDMDVLDYIKSQNNIAGYIKGLVKEEMRSRMFYKFVSANKGVVEVDVFGEYDGICKDISVTYSDNSAEFIETDDAEDVINWLIAEGVEFESRRSMAFNRDYIQHVMIERDMTEQQLLDDAAHWTDSDINKKLYMFD